MFEDVVIKIGIVGNFIKDNVKFILKRLGRVLLLNVFIIKMKMILY